MRTVLAAILCLLPTMVFSQSDGESQPAKRFGERLVYGGNLGLSFGDLTFLNLSPSVGYKVTEKFVVGPGVTYLYYYDRKYAYETQVYGGRLFGQYLFNDHLFAYGEYEVLNGQFDILEPTRRFNVVSPLIGAGYYQRLGGLVGFSLMALWNLNDNRYSPNGPNPVIRGGFNVGL